MYGYVTTLTLASDIFSGTPTTPGFAPRFPHPPPGGVSEAGMRFTHGPQGGVSDAGMRFPHPSSGAVSDATMRFPHPPPPGSANEQNMRFMYDQQGGSMPQGTKTDNYVFPKPQCPHAHHTVSDTCARQCTNPTNRRGFKTKLSFVLCLIF